MSLDKIITQQYQKKVNQAVKRFDGFILPAEGWLKTIRQALGMSGAQLAKRLGVTKGRVSQAENAELEGGITIKTMHNMAAAMNCRFVYAIIPEKDVEIILRDQALKKAKERVTAASTHMALEAQTLSEEKLNTEIERIAKEIIEKRPPDFWNDE